MADEYKLIEEFAETEYTNKYGDHPYAWYDGFNVIDETHIEVKAKLGGKGQIIDTTFIIEI